jgi:hypothetical protein
MIKATDVTEQPAGPQNGGGLTKLFSHVDAFMFSIIPFGFNAFEAVLVHILQSKISCINTYVYLFICIYT